MDKLNVKGISKSSCLLSPVECLYCNMTLDNNIVDGFVKAAKNGATGVELDLEFTSDGIPVLMHDNTVDRTTDGTGRLSDLTFEQIRKLNPAANHRLR